MGATESKKSLKDEIRDNKRGIDRAIRELDRERMKLEQQEKKLEADIRALAKKNQMNAVKIMAKDYVRTKNQRDKFMEMRAQLQAVSLRIQTMSSHEAMATAMKAATKSMIRMNRRMNLPAMQNIMRKFAMETERMDMTQEMMGDTIDDVMEGENDEEESEAVVGQVLAELGIGAMTDVPDAPSEVAAAAPAAAERRPAAVSAAAAGGGAARAPPPAAAGGGGAPAGGGGGDDAGAGGGAPDLSDLEARLNNLRK